MHLGAAAAGGRAKVKEETRDGVQWDFQSGGGGGRAGGGCESFGGRGHGRGTPAGDSSMPMDFLKEHGIDFDSMEVEPGVKRATAPPTNGATAAAEDGEDDLELSSSLLTMSLDKDVSIDEMGISACEKNLLGPLSSNVLDAIVLDDEQMKGLPAEPDDRLDAVAPGATARSETRAVAPRARHASWPRRRWQPWQPRGGRRARDDVAGQRRARSTAAAPAVAAAAAAAARRLATQPLVANAGRARRCRRRPRPRERNRCPLRRPTAPADDRSGLLLQTAECEQCEHVDGACNPGCSCLPPARRGPARGHRERRARASRARRSDRDDGRDGGGGGAAPTTQLRLSPAGIVLTQLTAQYREGLISESTKSAMKHAVLRGTASRSPASAVAAGNLTLSLDSSKLQDAQAGVAATTAPGAQAAAVPPTTIATCCW